MFLYAPPMCHLSLHVVWSDINSDQVPPFLKTETQPVSEIPCFKKTKTICKVQEIMTNHYNFSFGDRKSIHLPQEKTAGLRFQSPHN